MAVKSLWVTAIAAIVLAPLHTKSPSIQTFSDSGTPTSHPFSPLVSDAELRAAGRHRSARQLPTYAKRTRNQLISGAKKRRAMRTNAGDLSE